LPRPQKENIIKKLQSDKIIQS